jgi:hypothetical protein
MPDEDPEVRTRAATSSHLNLHTSDTNLLSDAQLCDYAVHAIWRSLDTQGLNDEAARAALAVVLDRVPKLALPERLPRLITTLRLTNPIDASTLYWLTRRLLTVVPELQAAATKMSRPEKISH